MAKVATKTHRVTEGSLELRKARQRFFRLLECDRDSEEFLTLYRQIDQFLTERLGSREPKSAASLS